MIASRLRGGAKRSPVHPAEGVWEPCLSVRDWISLQTGQDKKATVLHSRNGPTSPVDGCLTQPLWSADRCPPSTSVVTHHRQAFPPLRHFTVCQSSVLLTTAPPNPPACAHSNSTDSGTYMGYFLFCESKPLQGNHD